MFFAQHMANKQQAARHDRYLEYPKFVKVQGSDVLALDAEHEARLLGAVVPQVAPQQGPSETVLHNLTNMLAEPQKRGPGRPRKIELPEGVMDTSGIDPNDIQE